MTSISETLFYLTSCKRSLISITSSGIYLGPSHWWDGYCFQIRLVKSSQDSNHLVRKLQADCKRSLTWEYSESQIDANSSVILFRVNLQNWSPSKDHQLHIDKLHKGLFYWWVWWDEASDIQGKVWNQLLSKHHLRHLENHQLD